MSDDIHPASYPTAEIDPDGGYLRCGKDRCNDNLHVRGTVEPVSDEGRDESFRIPLTCEGGHEVDLIVLQRKGNLFLLMQQRDDRRPIRW